MMTIKETAIQARRHAAHGCLLYQEAMAALFENYKRALPHNPEPTLENLWAYVDGYNHNDAIAFQEGLKLHDDMRARGFQKEIHPAHKCPDLTPLPGRIIPPEFTAYCARPISGREHEDVVDYYRRIGCRLSAAGIRILTPTCGKGYVSNDSKWSKQAAKCVCTDHAIKERDKWMVQNSNIIFVNLVGAVKVSIGSVMELAWADMLNVHSVVALDEPNVHQHPFVVDCADIIFPTEEEALFYLEKLASGTLC